MKTLYHGTSSLNLACIKSIGLSPGHAKGGDAWAADHHRFVATLSNKRAPSVFVADDEYNAEDFALYAVEEMGGDPIIIVLHVPEKVFATFVADELYQRDYEENPHAWRAHSIPAACVVDVKPVKKRDPIEDMSLDDLMQALFSH